MRIVALLLVLWPLALPGLGERIRVEEPWLTAYDPRGRPLWELVATEVEGDAGGWLVRGATVRLYAPGGEVMVEARVAELSTDPQGTEWESHGPLEGEGKDFRFRAQEAAWDGEKLRLKELSFASGSLALRAESAVWRREGIWELVGVEATFGEWELGFARGIYRQEEGVLEVEGRLVARGWGWEVEAEAAVVDIPGEKVTLRGIRVVKA